MKLSSKYYLTLVFTLGLAPILLAQPPAPPATPIDGGLSLLLAAGGAYGVRKIIQLKSK